LIPSNKQYKSFIVYQQAHIRYQDEYNMEAEGKEKVERKSTEKDKAMTQDSSTTPALSSAVVVDDDENDDNDENDEGDMDNGKSNLQDELQEDVNVDEDPSMSLAFFFYWVLPILILAIMSRHGVDTELKSIPLVKTSASPSQPSRSISIKLDQDYIDSTPAQIGQSTANIKSPSPSRVSTAITSSSSKGPTAYRKVQEEIARRHRRWRGNDSQDVSASTESSTQSLDKPAPATRTHGAATDPGRIRFVEKINQLREEYRKNTNDLFKAATFADALRFYDVQYRDGGSNQQEAIQVYDQVVRLAKEQRQALIDAGVPTNVDKNGRSNVNEEVVLSYDQKSADGVLCAALSSQGKLYFMANMFGKSVESYTQCLEIVPYYLDVLNSRGSSLLILGKYKEAADDFLKVIQRDQRRLFTDSFTGLARILEAKESVVEQGWDTIVPILERLIPQTKQQLDTYPQAKQVLSISLSRYHQTLFIYHDTKTKNVTLAWKHLSDAHSYKMSLLPPWPANSEYMKTRQTKQIFKEGFWPDDMGSPTLTPIFIIGFPRSGSTLLERVLDAHPSIVGTGENSVFNGRLDDIRNQIVKASMGNHPQTVSDLTRRLGDEVVDEMKRRWQELNKAIEVDGDGEENTNPQRFVDKMLTNYNNVGFIHMLYPNALILHVYREPMDTLFSAYKHEFPGGNLDYTCQFEPLAELYSSYREIMEHWDAVLPGRVTHIRYEDMVHDMPGMARAIVDVTGLPWHDSVLEFHKKKHAVNTLSTTQVRKGVYKDSLQSWKRYEEQLKPLVQLMDKRIKFDIPYSFHPIQIDREL
jgi:tetratricopeptide (TPR) repeat protein